MATWTLLGMSEKTMGGKMHQRNEFDSAYIDIDIYMLVLSASCIIINIGYE